MDGESPPWSGTWPTSGTTRGGAAYQLPPWEPRTAASDCSSSPTLPTPRTTDARDAGVHGTGGLDLRTAVSLLPTPRASDGEKGGPNQRGSSGDLMMPSAALLLPTPAARDWKSGDSNIMDRNARPLNEVVQNLLPTPTAARYGNNQSPSPGAAVRPGLDSIAALLPTPRAMDSCATPEAPAAARHVAAGNGSLVEVIGVHLLLPTPVAADGERQSATYARGNPTLKGALMPSGDGGLPPSDGGNDSPDQPLTLWNWDDEETGA